MRVLETLSSTKATLAGRSVTDSRRFILIIARQLLSALIRLRLPFRARSRACIPDRNRANRLLIFLKRIENLDGDFKLLR